MALNYCLRCASLAVSFLIIWGGTPAIAADSTFVGVLALAAEEDVATELQLSPEVRTKLAALIEQRENEVGDLALEIKDLPAIERTAKLAPFVAESEKLGLALLTDEQKVRLGQIRLSQMGMASLAEPGIGSQLGLSAEQKDQIARLLAEMATEGAKGNELDRLRAKANYERQLKAVLSREQQAKWEGLAGRGGTLLAAAEPQPAVEPAAQPAANQPSSVAAGTPAAGDRPIKDLKDVKLTFTFDTAPWKDVIDWLAKEADLSLQVPSGYPAGTFNYRDTKSYSLREAMDVMNRTLFSFHGYLLVRRERLLVVWNLEEPIPHDWLVPIAPKELDDYGEFEFVRCLFQLTSITAEEAEAEATKLKSTAGTVVTLSRSRQLYVTDMAGKVRAIRDVIDPPVDPNNLPQIAMIPLGNLDATTVQNVLTSLLANRNPPVQITVEPKSNKLVVNGSLRDLEIIKTTLDQLSRDGAEIKVFKLKKLDPSEAMLHINSLFVTDASPPKIQADSINMRLIFFGSKSQISLVEKYLVGMGESLAVGGPDAELTQEVKSNVRVIPLTGRASRNVAKQFELTAPGIISNKLRIVIPPELASDTKERESFAIPRSLTNSAPRTQAPAAPQGQPSDPRFGPGSGPGFGPGQGFGPGGFGPGGFNPGFDPRGGGPGFPGRYRDRDRDDDRDRGEGDDRGRDRDRDRGPDDRATQLRPGYPLRMLPLEVTQFVSEEQAEEPATAEKKAESADAPPASEPAQPADPLSQRFGAQVVASVNALLRERDQNADGQIDTEEWKAGEGTMPLADADLDGDGRLSKLELCLQLEKTPAVAAVAQPAPTTDSSADAANQPLTGDEVVVIVTPTGWIIRSNDTDALDKLEEYLSSQIPPSGTKEFSIFYLKFAKAENAAALLQEVLGGAPSSDSGGGGGLMGDLAAGMMGNMMGNMFGNMFGGGGGFSAVTTSGNVSVIPDPRLNALFVQASPSDLDTVEKLLQLIDQSESPDPPQTMPGPRFIVVKNANVEDVATTVRQVYASKLTAEGGGQQRQPSPEDFIRAIAGQRGGRRGGGGGGSQQRGEEQKMTIGVDVTSNTLIVSAPDYLFNEVKSLVTELDSAAGQQEQTVSVVKLERTSPDIVAQSLSSVLGSSMSSRGSNSTSSRTTSSRSGSQNTSSSRTPNFGGGGGFNPGGFGGGGGFNPGGFGGGGGFNPGGFGGGGGFNPGGGFNRGGGFGGFGGGGGSRGGRGR